MASAQNRDNHASDIVRLYDVNKLNQRLFRFLWSKEYLRYGLWEPGTRTIRQALQNTDLFVADRLRVSADDRILDAGCGVGGSAVFMAANYGAKVVGINLCESQLQIARRSANTRNLQPLVRFSRQDYHQTAFPDSSFTKAYAIESVYHSDDPRRFADEMFRLLAPGGLLAVVDRFLVTDRLSPPQAAAYQAFAGGQAVNRLPTVAEFRECLNSAGFEAVQVTDKMAEARECIRRSSRLVRITYPVTRALSYLGLVPADGIRYGQSLMGMARLFDEGVATYRGFLARKSGSRQDRAV